ncbi:MAG: DNA internalization-related competence protein ComEC/Rec2, partial [Lachnospiraceae bacterium]|nr:DNA internalization-related competence protein ComEC/Rec2 [Lachnospiraceae bacterium]
VSLVFVLTVMIAEWIIVPKEPILPFADGVWVQVEGEVERAGSGQMQLRTAEGERFLCDLAEGEVRPKIGQWVRVEGKSACFYQASNPGEFDQSAFYRLQGLTMRIRKAKVIAASKDYRKYREGLQCIREALARTLDQSFAPVHAAILKAMLLGDRTGLTPEIKQLYQESGIIHILAISGLHISILGMGLYHLLRAVNFPAALAAPLATIAIISYGLMTGMGASSVRAIGMFMIALGGELLRRTYDMLTAMSLMALCMLIGQPQLVKQSGFLLSYGAIIAIALFLPVWKEMWHAERYQLSQMVLETLPVRTQRMYRLRAALLSAVWTSSAISVVTLPILLWFQFTFPLYSVLLNLLVLPLMGIVVYDAILVMGCALLLSPMIARILSLPDRLILPFYEWICTHQQLLPGSLLILGRPAPWQIACYALILLVLVFEAPLRALWNVYGAPRFARVRRIAQERLQKTPGRAVRVRLLLVAVALLILCVRPRIGLQVHFVDVGQGDGIVLMLPDGTNYMIDGGSTTKSNVGTYQLLPFLKSRGIGTLDAVFVTHPDEDHLNGIVEILNQSTKGLKVRRLILPNVSKRMKMTVLSEIVSVAKDNGVTVGFLGAGDTWRVGKAELCCLSPEPGSNTEEVNEVSIVLFLRYFDFTALFTGDVTGAAEQKMAEHLASCLQPGEQLTVLKVAHHGSRYSTPQEFLQQCDPKLAIISSGRKNSYGHPHRELLDRLTAQQIPYLNTQTSGEICIHVRSGRVAVEEFFR